MFDFYKLINKYSPIGNDGMIVITPDPEEPAEAPTETVSNPIEEVIKYIMHTPGNTNPNILRGILQNMGGSEEKYGFKVTIVNNTKDDISYGGYILSEDGFDSNWGRYVLISESIISFQSCAAITFDDSIPTFSYEYSIIDDNHDYNITVTSDVFTIEYLKVAHFIQANLSSPITEDITITINEAS